MLTLASVRRSASSASVLMHKARPMSGSHPCMDIMDLKAKMTKVLELFPCPGPAAPIAIPSPPSPMGVQEGWAGSSQLVQEDTLSIATSGDGASFSSEMQVGETLAEEEPGSESVSEASTTPLSSSISALVGRAAAFLQLPWTPASEPRWSVFRKQTLAPHPQRFPAFPHFLEESIWVTLGQTCAWSHLTMTIPKIGGFIEMEAESTKVVFREIQLEAKGSSAAARAEVSALGASAMVRGELASASASVGPVGVKVGLGVDTGASIGVEGIEAKVLGTGFSIGPKTSISVLGSEASCSVM
ncbi:hypothetical protein EOD39_16613 [Acipenser ruthenus]|uniref:Uncharacterized protein n=1 Tax=Acipenser ruthenus TaxID=7906 RepID=A0A444U9B0_ACIRT|nr:hypothetical protein EOD39_16613 [Acipenser ruthenus]